ncbi:MAG: hypothetical protein QOD71_1532 [Thermoleophilaceae bacterium]|nr:hypothetical protein [Thermoleophilaceae bacterium]
MLAPTRSVAGIAHAAGLPHDLNALEAGCVTRQPPPRAQLARRADAERHPRERAGRPAPQPRHGHGRRYLDGGVIAAPLPYRDGCVEAPGLGVEVDVAKVERYAARREVSSPDRARPAEEVST